MTIPAVDGVNEPFLGGIRSNENNTERPVNVDPDILFLQDLGYLPADRTEP